MIELPIEGIHGIFHAVIEPNFSIYTSSPTPVTVFLGTQPGAGKTNAQSIITGMYGFGSLMPIVGDDFRSYHPDYEMLLKTSPLEMPNKTARAEGIRASHAQYRANYAHVCYTVSRVKARS